MYEERFGTGWTTIDDREEAVERAFALGVAARLGERHPGELDRISDAIDTTYDRSFVELAYHEGREKAADVAPDADDDEQVWKELVEEKTVIDPEDRPDPSTAEDDEDGLPEAVRGFDVDTRPDDSTETVERPSLLDRQSSQSGPGPSGGEERTVFGRKRTDVGPDARPDPDGSDTDSEADADREDSQVDDDAESGESEGRGENADGSTEREE